MNALRILARIMANALTKSMATPAFVITQVSRYLSGDIDSVLITLHFWLIRLSGEELPGEYWRMCRVVTLQWRVNVLWFTRKLLLCMPQWLRWCFLWLRKHCFLLISNSGFQNFNWQRAGSWKLGQKGPKVLFCLLLFCVIACSFRIYKYMFSGASDLT